MPALPKKVCAHAGCARLVTAAQSKCEQHISLARKRFDKRRGSAAQRGYDKDWRVFRLAYLSRHPLCVSAEHAHLVVATEIDHILPLRDRPDLKFQESNLQALCKSCHSRKTSSERGWGWGWGKKN